MLKSSLCDFSDACILVKGRIRITGVRDDAAPRQVDERNEGVIFTHGVAFINCKMKQIIQKQTDSKVFILIPMYSLIEYSGNYPKKHLELYGNITEMSQMTIKQILNHLNLK